MAAAAVTTTSCAIHISSGCRPPSSPISNSSTSATLSLSSSFSSALKNHSIFIHFKKDYIINSSNKKKTKSKKNNKGLEGSTLDIPSMRYWSRGNWSAAALGDEYDVIRLQSNEESTGRECYTSLGTVMEREWKDEGGLITTSEKVTALAFQGGGTTGGLGEVASFSSSSSSTSSISATTSFDRNGGGGQQDPDKFRDRAINATIVLAAGTFVITKLLTVDQDYWHGWTLFEILRYAPQHNWIAYEEALRTNPVLAKMMISGIVYSVGDWIAQCYEGKPLFEFDRARMFRSGLVGFTLHGSLSHYYYHFCEAIFPFEAWWVVPAKVAFDQTIWSAIWNSIYFVVLGFLRLESPLNIFSELRRTFWPLLTAGWKLWPFAHLVTYGLIPVEQRLLWVDCVELVWVTILSTYSNENSEKKNLEISSETDATS